METETEKETEKEEEPHTILFESREGVSISLHEARFSYREGEKVTFDVETADGYDLDTVSARSIQILSDEDISGTAGLGVDATGAGAAAVAGASARGAEGGADNSPPPKRASCKRACSRSASACSNVCSVLLGLSGLAADSGTTAPLAAAGSADRPHPASARLENASRLAATTKGALLARYEAGSERFAIRH
jgi:hypothetical protein